jgi:hypothetical protein
MSFYVTLPSNSKSNEYSNTTTSFTTKIAKPLDLRVEFEVALVEMIYRQKWFKPAGFIKYSYELELSKEIGVIFYDGERINSFLDRINRSIEDHIIIKSYQRRYNIFQKRKEEFLSDFQNLNKIFIPDKKDFLPRFEYNSNESENDFNIIDFIRKTEKEFIERPILRLINNYVWLRIGNQNTKVQFFGEISNTIKTTLTYNDHISPEYAGNVEIIISKDEIFDDQILLVGTLYVYTDIIDSQYLGDILSPLLRTVVVDHNYQKTIWTHYDNPHYLRVNKTQIETINIYIRDEQGNKVLFEDSNIIVKLHFRPKI